MKISKAASTLDDGVLPGRDESEETQVAKYLKLLADFWPDVLIMRMERLQLIGVVISFAQAEVVFAYIPNNS